MQQWDGTLWQGMRVLSGNWLTLKVKSQISSNNHVITILADIKNKSYSIQAWEWYTQSILYIQRHQSEQKCTRRIFAPANTVKTRVWIHQCQGSDNNRDGTARMQGGGTLGGTCRIYTSINRKKTKTKQDSEPHIQKKSPFYESNIYCVSHTESE